MAGEEWIEENLVGLKCRLSYRSEGMADEKCVFRGIVGSFAVFQGDDWAQVIPADRIYEIVFSPFFECEE